MNGGINIHWISPFSISDTLCRVSIEVVDVIAGVLPMEVLVEEQLSVSQQQVKKTTNIKLMKKEKQ